MSVHEVDCLLESMDSVLALLGDSTSPSGGCNPFVRRGRFTRSSPTSTASKKRSSVGDPPATLPAPFEIVGKVFEEVDDWPPDRLLGRLRTVLAGRRSELLAADASLFDEASWTPVGIQTYGRFMAIRNFDFWVHEQDIRVPLGRPGHTSGPAAELALDEVRRSFGYIVGKRAAIPDGSSVLVELHGPIEAKLAAVVDGRARVVEHLDHPDAIVRTDFLTFMLLACGRVDPETHLANDDIQLQGNKELAAQLVRNLRFTI